MELLLIGLIIVLSLYKKGLLYDAPIPKIMNVIVDENKYVNINFEIKKNGINDKIYFINSKIDEIPLANSTKWKQVSGNSVKYYLDDIYYSFFKNEDDVIIKVENTDKLGYIKNLNISKNTIYLAVKGTYTPTLTFDSIGYVDKTITWYSDNEKIAKVNNDGKITGVKKGTTKVHAKILNNDISIDVIVTNLIVAKPKKINRNKKYLPCGIYNKEENDLIDKILKDRINDAGYKTRAGVVEAARFLTLEFPYKIKYFSENGRLSLNGVDGEGRYYHKGLYLDESRFKNLKRNMHGPATWGCSMYSNPAHKETPNGLDCSGFISWVLYNGGFNVKDIGAGINGSLDLTDYGKRTILTEKIVKSGKIKVGDMLANGGMGGGHIALIVGEDSKNYYVAESLWTYPNVGVLIMKYKKTNFHRNFNYVMLMDKYYKKDGNLTNMW